MEEKQTYMAQLANIYTSILEKKLGSTGKDIFDCVITGGTFLASFKDMGDGIIVGRFNYESVFMFEGLPTSKLNPYILMASTVTWLHDNDEERKRFNFPPPKIEVDAYSTDGTPVSDMEITLQFSEEVTMKETSEELGDVFFNNKWWGIAPYTLYVAEETKVIANENRI